MPADDPLARGENARQGTGAALLWIALALFAAHVGLALLLRSGLSFWDTLCVVLVQAAACLVCFLKARASSEEPRILWRLLGTSILIAVLSGCLLMGLEIRGAAGSGSVRALIVVMNTLYASALLFTVSLRFDPRVSRTFRVVTFLLPLAICVLFFVLSFAMISLHARTPEDLLPLTRLFDGMDIFVAVLATSRLLGSDQSEERALFFVACAFLWANTIIPEIRSQLLVLWHGPGRLDLPAPLPYVLLVVLAGRPMPRIFRDWQPSAHLSTFVRSAVTVFLSFGLLFVGMAAMRTFFWVGVYAVLLSIVFYALLSGIILNRGIHAEEALMAANRKLEALAGSDGLTGIANRRTFDERLKFELNAARRSGQPLSLLMIDLDFFKALNDAKGHHAGDASLIAVAQALADALPRSNDFAARYGGEEFAVILPSTAANGATKVADTVHKAVARLALEHPVSPSGSLTISIGLATAAGGDDGSPTALVEAADRALYRAKALGRNRTEHEAITQMPA